MPNRGECFINVFNYGEEQTGQNRGLAIIAITMPRGNPTWFLKMRIDLGLGLA